MILKREIRNWGEQRSKIPRHYIGVQIIQFLRQKHVIFVSANRQKGHEKMRQWRRAITTTQNAFSSIVLMSGNLKEMKSALAENCLFSGALFAFKNFIFPFVFFHQIFTITPFLIASRTSTFSSLFSTFTHWIVFYRSAYLFHIVSVFERGSIFKGNTRFWWRKLQLIFDKHFSSQPI